MDTVTIADGVSEAVIVPGSGAGLASYDLVLDGSRAPLFRPCRDLGAAKPFDLGNKLFVPWSGRISGGGVPFRGRFHALSPNVERAPHE